jgi:hypothetical protein
MTLGFRKPHLGAWAGLFGFPFPNARSHSRLHLQSKLEEVGELTRGDMSGDFDLQYPYVITVYVYMLHQ